MTEHIYRGECRLKRWSDSSAGGRTITLEIDAEGLHPFRGYEGERFAVMIVPIGNDEKPMKKDTALAQRQSTQSVQSDATDTGSTPVGGATKPKQRWKDMRPSARAALLTKDPEFWEYISMTLTSEDPLFPVTTEAAADTWLKEELYIQSKAIIDTDENKREHFHDIEANFFTYRNARQMGAA